MLKSIKVKKLTLQELLVVLLMVVTLTATSISGFQGFITGTSYAATTLPSAPQYVEAMADQTQVAVTWDPPVSTGGETLNYTARLWTVPPPTTSVMFGSCTTTGLGCVITGLVSGTSYYVDVVATNSAGSSGPSGMKQVAPGRAGSPPTNVTATSDGTGKVTIKWAPQTSLGPGQFAWYTAELLTGPDISAGAYKFYCTADNASASSCSIPGLKSGTSYYAQVRTISSLGSSYPSSPRIKIVVGATDSENDEPTPTPTVKSCTTPVIKAGPTKGNATGKLLPPQKVKVTLKGNCAQVSWKPPTSTTDKRMLGYYVGAYLYSDWLLASCTTKFSILSCAISLGDAKGPVRIRVIANYQGSKLVPAKDVIIEVPK